MTDAERMVVARALGGDFPPDGVADTPENRQLWDEIGADLAEMHKQHIGPDVPWEYADGEGL